MSELLDRLRSIRDDLLEVEMPDTAYILDARIAELEYWEARDAAVQTEQRVEPRPLPPIVADENCPPDRIYILCAPEDVAARETPENGET